MGLQLSGSVQLEGNLLVTGSANSVFENVLVTGTLVAQEIETQLVSSSIIYSSGSNKFGDLVTDTQQFTGSVDVSGSLSVNGAGSFSSTLATEGNITVTANSAAVRVTESGGADVRIVAGGSSGFFGTYSNHPLILLTNSENKVTISGSNVGVGTGTPTNGKVEIQQTDTTAGLWVQTGGTTSAYTIADFRTGTNLSALQLFGNGAATFGNTISINTSETIMRFGNLLRWGFQRPTADNRYVSFMRNMDATATSVWTVDGDNGRIGIGSDTPTNPLHVETTGTDLGIQIYRNVSADGGSAPLFMSHKNNGGTINTVNIEALGNGNMLFRTGATGLASFGTARLSIAGTGDGSVTVSTGNLVIGTAGKGIDFSADGNAAGMTSELLDDYEEGTWTPEVSAESVAPTGVTYNHQGGSYVKIGNTVFVKCGINIANVGTGGSGQLIITGLPFTSANAGGYREPTAMATGGRWVTAGNAGNVYAFIANSNTKFVFRTMASNDDTQVNYSELQGGSETAGTWFILVTHYQVS